MRSIQAILLDEFDDIVQYNIYSEDKEIDCIKTALHILTVCNDDIYREIANHEQAEQLLANYMDRFGINSYFIRTYAESVNGMSSRDLMLVFVIAEALWDLYVKLNKHNTK